MMEIGLAGYRAYLVSEERSGATVEKYLRDVGAFLRFLGKKPTKKEELVAYKQALAGRYAPSSINSMLGAVNNYLGYLGLRELRVRLVRSQRQIFCRKERELTRREYERLLRAAEWQHGGQLCLVMQTICATGIRVSELPFITAGAARRGRAEVTLKGKTRTVLLPKELTQKLLGWCNRSGITAGPVFVTRGGKPLDRSNIWHAMKRLCGAARVDPRKVFPHNLRHLFAVTYYRQEKDIARLADLLGHSSVETTRIYTTTSGGEHTRKLSQMRLVI